MHAPEAEAVEREYVNPYAKFFAPLSDDAIEKLTMGLGDDEDGVEMADFLGGIEGGADAAPSSDDEGFGDAQEVHLGSGHSRRFGNRGVRLLC